MPRTSKRASTYRLVYGCSFLCSAWVGVEVCIVCCFLSEACVVNEAVRSTYLVVQPSGRLLCSAGWARWRWEWH